MNRLTDALTMVGLLLRDLLIVALLCGAEGLAYRSESERIVSEFFDQAQHGVISASSDIPARMGLLASDVRDLARSHALVGYLRDPSEGAARDLEVDWRSFAETRRIYDQIRLIDVQGSELLRIDFADGGARVVPPQDLQDKARR